jgi:cellulose synthase/poly-beta-1,6-N-acetylglucosamine synthase-like glycosyltransferase
MSDLFILLKELTVLETFLVFSCIVYVLGIGILSFGLTRIPYSKPPADKNTLPSVTVLVTARNEEEDIPDCIAALLRLNYPKEKLQIILVNDRSSDQTGEIIRKAAMSNPGILPLDTDDYDIELDGKARGIAVGFRFATGDWVAITDADGTVHPDWLLHLMGDIPDDIGMVGGSLVVEPRGWVGRVESISWSFVQNFNVGVTGFGPSIVCVGPNMAMRRSIYEDAGGLENVEFKVAEDLALFTMVTEGGFKVRNYMDEQTTVRLKPVPTLKHLMSQQRRWLSGGYSKPEYFIPLVVGFWYGFLYASVTLVGWLFMWKVWLIVAAVRLVVEVISMGIQGYRMNEKQFIRLFWVMHLSLPFIFTYLPASFVFSRKIHWRGKNYAIKYD